MAAVIGNPSFTIRDWCVEPTLNRLSRKDETVKIDPQNMKVLELLASRPGEVISQSEIEQTAWAGVIVSPNSVYQAIAQLRRALGDDKTNPKYIETIARKGYRLVAARAEVLSPAAAHSVEESRNPDTNPTVHAEQYRYLTKLNGPLARGATAALAIAALIVGTQSHWFDGFAQATADVSKNRSEFIPIGLEKESDHQRAERLASLAADASLQGRPRLAISYYEQALDLETAATGNRGHVGAILGELAHLYNWIDDYERAERTARHALRLANETGSEFNPRVISAHYMLGDALLNVGQLEEAETHLKRAIELASLVYGERDTSTARARYGLAVLLIHQGNALAAEALLRDVVQVSVAKSGEDDPSTAHYRAVLAMALFYMSSYEEGAAEAREAIRVLRETARPHHPYLGTAQQVLADCLIASGRYVEAADASRAAMQIWRENDEKPWRAARGASSLGAALFEQGQISEAEEYLTYATHIFEKGGSSLQQLAANLHHQRLRRLQAAKAQGDMIRNRDAGL